MVVFGTRPEAIKMCPVVIELKKHKMFDVVVCVSGQHREMLGQVLQVFHIIPDYNLDIMKEKQNLYDITINILQGIESILKREIPDIVLVHGDTSTSFATALACFYSHIKVGHVEAGLRTYNLHSPYPEEFNRQAVGLIADYHFAPTKKAKSNLIQEGKKDSSIFVTGNTAIDALKYTVSREFEHEELEWVRKSKMILLTAHRRENLGENMEHIFRAVKRIVEEYCDLKVIYPVHMNPVIKEIAYRILGDCDRVHMIEPLDVVAFHNLLARSYLVLTDSGGIQEEAPALGKPVLVMRDVTERPEGVEAGTLKMVGTKEETIYKNIKLLIEDRNIYKKMCEAKNPYGDGQASERIVDIIEKI